MRTFLAIPLTDDVKLILTEVQKQLRRSISHGVTWVDPSLSHITVKFLGDIEEGSIPDLAAGLMKVTHTTKVFNIQCGGLGCFPNIHQPRVIWLGVKREPLLSDLHAQIDNSLSVTGLPKDEKNFSPHLTLGRVKENLTISELVTLTSMIKTEAEKPLIEMPVREVILYKSVLSRTGPVYTQISVFGLGAEQK